MNYEELKGICYGIAETRADDIKVDVKVYQKTLDYFFDYLNKNEISPKDGRLGLSRAQVLEITRGLKLRKRSNLSKGTCFGDLLSQLFIRDLYQGGFPNLPQQMERKSALNISSVPIQSYDDFQRVRGYLLSPIPKGTDKPLADIAETYLSEFLASAYNDAGLWDDFHREVLCALIKDFTFQPLTVSLPLGQDKDDARNGKAFFRFWFSDQTEIYLLRLLLFLKKYSEKLELTYDGWHLFPLEWMNGEFLAGIPDTFKRWTKDILKGGDKESPLPLKIRAFRQLCIFDLLQVVPPFIITAMSGRILCDSLDDISLGLLDNTLNQATRLQSLQDTDKVVNKTVMNEEAKTILEEGRLLLDADPIFCAVADGIRGIFSVLSFKASRKERREAAANIESILTKLPDEGSQTTDKYLFNLLFLGRWMAFLLNETDYDQATIERRLSMIGAKFIYMLGNNAINELSTDILADIIIQTYSFYESAGISSDIMEFTNHLYDYQESIYPEMAWEALPWGRGNVLYKEKIRRTKPLISFQIIRDALKEVDKQYSGMQARRLRAAIILGFYAGLRIVEIAYLRRRNLIIEGGYVLLVRESKTKSGIRNIYIQLLLPPEELLEVAELFKVDGYIALTDDRYIFSDEDPDKEPEDARKTIPYEVAKILRSLGLSIATFHHLRHSFANWFIVRYIAAIYGIEIFPQDSAFLDELIFKEQYLGYVRSLFFGFGNRDEVGYDAFPHALLVLARLIGHYGPVTTMSAYLHNLDWIGKLFLSKVWAERTLDLNIKTVQEFMQVPSLTLPETLRKNSAGNILTSDIIREQLNRLMQK